MLTLPPSVKIYIAASPVDCRKGFDGLSSMVESTFGVDPLSGHLFVFINRRGDQVRILFFDRTGYCIVSKRLERGTFRLARDPKDGSQHVEVNAGELGLMLEGIELEGAKRRVRWHAPPPVSAAA
jgi:transposase